MKCEKKTSKPTTTNKKMYKKNVKFAGLSRKKLQNFMVGFLENCPTFNQDTFKTHNVVALEDLTYVINGGQSISNLLTIKITKGRHNKSNQMYK